MEKRNVNVLLHLARPGVGNDIRALIRDLTRLAGVARVAPGSRASNLLRIDYDPGRTLDADTSRARTTRLVGRAWPRDAPSRFAAADPSEDQSAALVGHHELTERRLVFGEPGPQDGFERQQARAAKTLPCADRRVVIVVPGVLSVEDIDVQVTVLAQPRDLAPAA